MAAHLIHESTADDASRICPEGLASPHFTAGPAVPHAIILLLLLGACMWMTEARASSPTERGSQPLVAESYLSPITLPIEVIGSDGYTVNVSVDLASPGQVAELYLQIHSPAYRDASINPGRGPKASVRLNNGPWVGITNGNVDVFDHESEYGGLNGSYHTIRMTIPISDLGTPQSTNTLRFRFNGTDGHTSGYRVIDLNFLRSSGAEILPAGAFQEDDPTLWAPISNNASYLAAGEDLWESAQLVDRPNGPSIQASCSDCHAQDGRDLWYFAFSNHSIIERSKFHGLSQEEGEKIASYIRSLQGSDETYTYDPPGRPWNPPFQPGPGLDLLPAYAWSAGAGVDAVLERDVDMVEFAFPSGINKNALDQSNPSLPAFNNRELPLSIQFPDWNEWLPDIHPKDVMTYGDNFDGTDFYAAYLSARERLASEGPAGVGEDLHDVVGEIYGKTKAYRVAVKGTSQAPSPSSNAWEDFQRSLFHWAAVKNWEVHREWDLEDEGDLAYGEHAEERTWLGGARTPFDLAPHISGNSQFAWQSELVSKYFSTVWYQAQQVVNAGNVIHTKPISPVDWNYQIAHINGLAKEGGPAHPMRLLLGIAKHWQLTWDFEANSSPAAFATSWGQHHPARFGTQNFTQTWGGIDNGTLALVYDAMLGSFMDRMDRHAYSDWPRRTDNGSPGFCDDDNTLLKPSSWNGDACTGWDYNNPLNRWQKGDGRYAEHHWHMVPMFREVGVRESTLNRLIDWGEGMWPRGNWDVLRVETTSAPEEYQLNLQSGWNTVALPVVPDDGSMAQIVGGVSSLVMVKDIGGDVFLPEYNIQTLSVWNPTQAYRILVDNNATVNVTGTLVDPSETPISLQAGWNLLPYFLDSPRSVEAALAPILDEVQYLTDNDSGIYDPASGTNTVGMLQPGQGYLVRLATATTLVYPSN